MQELKIAILAGGLGTRLLEETQERPKALVQIGDQPILSHIMRYYAFHGFGDFVVALGYKGEMIRQHFAGPDSPDRSDNPAPCPLRLEGAEGTARFVDTGLDTQTGGRIKRLAPFLGSGTFMLTWCDGLTDVDLRQLLAFHRSHGKLATLTAVPPPSRFGHVKIDGDQVVSYAEKPPLKHTWISGAYFVLEPEVLDYIDGDDTHWERGPLDRLASDGQLMAYRHAGFWQCMDTLNERIELEKLWNFSGSAPWKVW